MYESDLHTIYKLIEIHASFNGSQNKDNNNTQKKDTQEVYIDNIMF